MADIQKHLHYLKYNLKMKIECNKIPQMMMFSYIQEHMPAPTRSVSFSITIHSLKKHFVSQMQINKEEHKNIFNLLF